MPETRDKLVTALTAEWSRLGAELVLLSQAVADRLKINVTDLQCLALLMSTGPMTAGQVADATGLTTGAITGVIDRLEKAGLATRADDPADRRRVIVRAAPDAALAASDPETSAALAALAAATAEAYDDYSDRELQLVVDALRRAHPILLEHVSQLRRQPAVRHALDAPRAGASEGTLFLTAGFGKITVDADPSMSELYRADIEGTPPIIEVDGGRISVKPRRGPLFGWGARKLRLTLSGAIPWDIEVDQGAYAFTADVRALTLRSFTVDGGAARVDLIVGQPSGVVPITIGGGANLLRIRRPRDVPVEVRVKGGASRVTVDGRELGPARNLEWSSPAASTDTARYVIEIRGGASRVDVEPV